MTANQLAYLNLQESGRHNVVTEKETTRANRAREQYETDRNEITYRNNIWNRDVAQSNLEEQIRSHKANENIQTAIAAETKRNNMAQTELGYYQSDNSLAGQKYVADSNRKSAKYTADSNRKSSKYASDTSAAASRYSADTSAAASRYNTDINKELNEWKTAVSENNKAAMQRQQIQFQKWSKNIDQEMQDKDLSQKDRSTLAKIQSELDKLNKTKDLASTDKIIDSITNLLGDLGPLVVKAIARS